VGAAGRRKQGFAKGAEGQRNSLIFAVVPRRFFKEEKGEQEKKRSTDARETEKPFSGLGKKGRVRVPYSEGTVISSRESKVNTRLKKNELVCDTQKESK